MVGHRVVGEVVVGASGVVSPAYRVTIGLEPWAVTVVELGEDSTVGPGQQLFGWVHWWDSKDHFVGYQRSSYLYAPKDDGEGGGFAVLTSGLQVCKDTVGR